MKLRSLLYVPASSEKFIAKAHERGADAIILDLEDAVAPADKDRARAALTEAVPAVGRSGAKVFVRLNAEPNMQLADAEAACRAGAFGLYVAKTRSLEQLWRLSDHIEPLERELGRAELAFVPLIEDAAAVLEARTFARYDRTLALTSGGEDLAASVGAEPLPDVLRLPKLMIHLAAKAEGRLSLGTLGSTTNYSDLDGIAAAAREARMHGFDGASCVHPSVVPVLNGAFMPSDEQVAWARRVIEAVEANGEGAFALDGKMIDAPIVTRARNILAQV
ncbi:Citrate lyase beta chain [Devosia sp. H5989]|nr:Citrate lyase beta chain [Devosia sp. H5989]